MNARSRRVALATCAAWPRLSPDDRLLLEALHGQGIAAEPAVWDEPAVEWDRFDAVMIRSCWDYHLRASEFLAWIDRVESLGAALWNPAQVLRWNADRLTCAISRHAV